MKNVFTFLLLLGLCVAPAMASSTLNFTLGFDTTPFAVSYAGGSTPLVGTGIQVQSVTGLGTPANNGVSIPIFGTASGSGTLDFQTGNFTGSTSTTWNFSSGGTITINGCADIDLDFGGGCDAQDVNGLLLTGTFTGTPSVSFSFVKFMSGIGSDTKNSDLLKFFGLTSGGTDSFTMNYEFIDFSAQNPPSAFSNTLGLQGSLPNTIPNAVPEPSTLTLLGAGLLGLGCLVRRKSGLPIHQTP